MSDVTVSVGGGDARQSMIRVWMAISAIWIAFWILIAAMVLATFGLSYSPGSQLQPYVLILALPPAALLVTMMFCRWAYVGLGAAMRRGGAPVTHSPIFDRIRSRIRRFCLP